MLNHFTFSTLILSAINHSLDVAYLEKEINLLEVVRGKICLQIDRSFLLNDKARYFSGEEFVQNQKITKELQRSRRTLEFSLRRYFEDKSQTVKSLEQIVTE